MVYKILYALCKGFYRLMHHGVKVCGAENLPEGPAILCSNHEALSDPVYIGLAVGRGMRLHYMAKAELFRSRLGRWFFTSLGAFPVERGKADVAAVRESVKVLGASGKLLIFPEGTRTIGGRGYHDGKPVRPKAGAAVIAALSGVPVVPVSVQNARDWKRPVIVRFGMPMQDIRREDAQRSTNEIMARIRALNDAKLEEKP